MFKEFILFFDNKNIIVWQLKQEFYYSCKKIYSKKYSVNNLDNTLYTI